MKKHAGFSPSLGLLVLSALWAVGWLLPDLFPHWASVGISLPMGQAILFSVFAVSAGSIAVARRQPFPRGRRAWGAVGAGVGLFVIPAGADTYARGSISSFDAVAVLCLVPVFAVVLEPYLQNCSPRRGKGALAGCLIAIAGILCFLPLETPSSVHAGVALCALLLTALEIAAANCVAVSLAQRGAEGSIVSLAAEAAGAGALGLFVMALLTPKALWTQTAWPIFIPKLLLDDIPGLCLLFWLMTRMAASRMTARFLLTPLFAAGAGLAMERMLPPPRGMLGLLLLAAGAGWLVFAPAEPETEGPISVTTMPTASPSREE